MKNKIYIDFQIKIHSWPIPAGKNLLDKDVKKTVYDEERVTCTHFFF